MSGRTEKKYLLTKKELMILANNIKKYSFMTAKDNVEEFLFDRKAGNNAEPIKQYPEDDPGKDR